MTIPDTTTTITSVIELIGLILALVAIGLAFWHARNLKILVGEMRSQAAASSRAFAEMQKSISTRYVAHFPLYFKDIVALIDEAQERIDIFCDFPAYGSFSSREYFLDYRHKLEKKLDQGITVEITCLSREGRSALVKEQFLGRHGDWDKKKYSEAFGTQLADFLDAHGKRSELAGLTLETFLGMIEQEDTLMLTEFLSKAAISQIKAHVPIYFWLIDNRKAIFSIASLSEKEIEHGFVTTDSSLIKALISMRRRYNSTRGLLAIAAAPRMGA